MEYLQAPIDPPSPRYGQRDVEWVIEHPPACPECDTPLVYEYHTDREVIFTCPTAASLHRWPTADGGARSPLIALLWEDLVGGASEADRKLHERMGV